VTLTIAAKPSGIGHTFFKGSCLSLQQPLSSTNFLYELDRITKDILGVIMESQKTSVPGDQIGIPGATDKVSFSDYVKDNVFEAMTGKL